MIAFLGFLMAFLSVLVCPFIFCFKCCTCGGWKPSEGICCLGGEFNPLDGDGYTRKEVWIILGCTVGAFLLCAYVPSAQTA